MEDIWLHIILVFNKADPGDYLTWIIYGGIVDISTDWEYTYVTFKNTLYRMDEKYKWNKNIELPEF